MDRFDSETRDFLLTTSLLPSMTVHDAAEFTGNEHASRILSQLNRDNFFTEKHSAADSVYSYHPLFREFLLSRVKESLNREGLARMQARAASIAEESGRVEEAAALFIEAQDWKD